MVVRGRISIVPWDPDAAGNLIVVVETPAGSDCRSGILSSPVPPGIPETYYPYPVAGNLTTLHFLLFQLEKLPPDGMHDRFGDFGQEKRFDWSAMGFPVLYHHGDTVVAVGGAIFQGVEEVHGIGELVSW